MPEKQVSKNTLSKDTLCIHCGDPCKTGSVYEGEKAFCCHGCQAVYHLLSENNLNSFYDIHGSSGISLKNRGSGEQYEYLDDDSIRLKLLDFTDGETSRVTLSVPQMYCSACIWLLENLQKIEPAIIESRVDFPRRILVVSYREKQTNLRRIVELLSAIGYSPRISLQSVEKRSFVRDNRRLVTQTGIAGFAFANIMLFSFPDYLAGEGGIENQYQQFFSLLSLLLALPVFFYSAVDFFRAAYQGLRVRQIHLDLPLSIGIVALFVRSVHDVLTQSGTGYFDSFTGLVFFLLIGRIVQSITYRSLAFDRDYKSYFPLSVAVKKRGESRQIALSRLSIGDVIVARNNELIVADSVLRTSKAMIDYSFVTGESRPVLQRAGAMLYAGGRVVGSPIEAEVVKEVSQGYMISLWSSKKFKIKPEGSSTRLSKWAGERFTLAVVLISLATMVYWIGRGWDVAIANTTAVLIVACPCALALSIPFAFGTAMQIFGRVGLFLRESGVVEVLASVNTIVFDKTGTLTTAGKSDVAFHGQELTSLEKSMLLTLSSSSTHPLSRKIAAWANGVTPEAAKQIEEVPGMGIIGRFAEAEMRIGSRNWILGNDAGEKSCSSSEVFVAVDGVILGRFEFERDYRESAGTIVPKLADKYDLHLVSGDNASSAPELAALFADPDNIHFNQTPHDKLDYVDNMKSSGKRVLMIGDGLNDSGALAVADVGIAIAEEVAAFSPASDAILSADKLELLPKFLRLSKRTHQIVMISFAISLLYNVIGVYFAFTGQLSPLFAAVLMPVSSISVVGFAVLMTRLAASRLRIS